MAVAHVPIRQASQKPGKLHLYRRYLSAAAEESHPGGDGFQYDCGRRDVLDRSDGRGWQANPVALRATLRTGSGHREWAGTGLRGIWWDAGNDLGSNYQSHLVADWRDSHRFFASRQTRFQLFRVAGAGDSQSPQRRGYFVLGGHI